MDKIVTIIIFGIISISSFILLIVKMKGGIGKFNLKIYGITLIGLLVVLLAISDYETTKLAPAYGILGAIIGYLFGIDKEKS